MSEPLRFGVATADHQCEAYDGHDDIRDVWERVRGLVPRGKATDFWSRYAEDVQLAKSLGCSAFRLSLSWARLEPEPGKWSDEAFAHYRQVLQCMRSAGMLTIVTLVHNTWPLHVQESGGLLGDDFPDVMARFAGIVAERLGDLIDYYVTLNEPNQLVYGYIKGFWMRAYAMPPGQPPDLSGEGQMDDVLRVIPNLFRAHTRSRAAIHKHRAGAKVGTNPLVLGLPRWLQRLIDRNATHLQSPEHAKKQAARITQSSVLEGGRVDVSIAQLTMTQLRHQRALFSQPYFTAHLALLHDKRTAPPSELETWRGSVGVVYDMLPASLAPQCFPAAKIVYFKSTGQAVNALQQKQVDAIFDDDVQLKPYVDDARALMQVPGHPQHFAVAMAFGSESLLHAVDHVLQEIKQSRSDLPSACNRETLARHGEPADGRDIERIRERGVLRVGVHPGTPTLCERDAKGNYAGLEPDIARSIARRILGDETKVAFVPLRGDARMSATRSWLQALFAFRKTWGFFGTLLGTNWWNLGMAGKLPAFLCPRECVGTLDYVGFDYYWGVPSFWPGELHRLTAASEFHYASAPVWPGAMEMILREQAQAFPGKEIIVIENGCVTSADGFTRAKYVEAHIGQVVRARKHGIPVVAYICWSITSNREWGLPFDDNSDFGLYHIDLDTDPELKRIETDSSKIYRDVIARRGVSR